VPVLFSGNPSVFTDAGCYLEWIASQYNLTLSPDYSALQYCNPPYGSKEDMNKTKCMSRTLDPRLNETLPCDFSKDLNGCNLYAYANVEPSTNSNFFTCNNTNGSQAVCANNCLGVDPNAVVVGGILPLFAPLAVAAAAQLAPDLMGAALGAGSILGAMGLGMVSMNMRQNACPAGQCRARFAQRCCRLVRVSGQQVCPSFC